ncbi:MAG: hypothetical protein PHR28_12595 [candidate division Zixibacteria bacterium]|nr:hypothetical protein [candidate division Zixibacteria bacterium]
MCKKILFAVTLAAGLIVALTAIALAQDTDVPTDKGAYSPMAAPNTIMYQGRLTTAAGAPITDTVTVTFGIYASTSGGTALWQGAWLLHPDANGIISQEIGTIPDTVFTGSQRYLQITVRSDPAMSPRQTITSAPYSMSTRPTATQSTYGFQFVTYKSTSPSAPIAFGFISSDGSVISGTGNFTASWNSGTKRYEITITSQSYFYNTYTTVITPSGSPELFQTGSVSGMLLVYVYRL